MRRSVAVLIPICLLLTGAACQSNQPKGTTNVNTPISNPPGALTVLPDNERTGQQARIETSKGTVVIELLGQDVPIATSNFISLAKRGFYDGLKFHRYVAGFVIQGGDPQGTGYGGPGYSFIDEPVVGEYTAGTVAMANSGPNTNGSQFFIVLDDQPQLPKSYTVFGRVTSGLDIVQQLRAGDIMTKVAIQPAAGS